MNIKSIFFCHFVLSLCVVAEAAEIQPVMRAGAAVVDITPQTLPVRVAGNIAAVWASKVEDPLHARCLVLDDGPTTLAICVVDSCMMPREMLDAAKAKAHQATGIPVGHMLISATHTHTAPAVMGVHGTDPHPDYREWVTQKIVEVITQAHQKLQPARIGWGAEDCHEFVFCRRWIMKPGTALTVPFTGRTENQAQMNPGHDNPNKVQQTGPVDPAVSVLAVQTLGGQPLALLANYSTHYAGSVNVSADYFGVFARRIGELIAATNQAQPFVGIMSNGTSGDANCIDFSQPKRDFTRFTVAEAVAQAAGAAYRKIQFRDRVVLAMEEARLSLKVRLPNKEEVASAQAYLQDKVKDRPIRNWEENYARETVLVSQMAPEDELKLQVIRIGELALTAIPCEVYGSTGLKLKKESPFGLTMNIELANGAHGYLPPPDQFILGGYTTWRARTSFLETNAEPQIVKNVLDLLKRVR